MAQVKVNKVKCISYNQHAWPQVHDRRNFSTEWVVRIKIELEGQFLKIQLRLEWMKQLHTYQELFEMERLESITGPMDKSESQ